ncbi:hypothetical protein DB771_14600 [Burkholderia sp. AU29985]|nr:hypothetical protein EGY28_04415 [Burkholderia dolosa]ETP63866.1 hypothetical protein BDSB_25670 [Burkholderia dolosa PC543]PUA76158.1 hypothetical protein DB771_14600 [Burkholderia sp. AU29985]
MNAGTVLRFFGLRPISDTEPDASEGDLKSDVRTGVATNWHAAPRIEDAAARRYRRDGRHVPRTFAASGCGDAELLPTRSITRH